MATTMREPIAIHREGSELGAETRAAIVQSLNRRLAGAIDLQLTGEPGALERQGPELYRAP